MKKIIYSLLAIILIAGSACKKESVTVPQKAFEDITYQDIKNLESKFSSNTFGVGSSTGKGPQIGAVILYKTKSGVLGKMRISNFTSGVVSDLTFDMVNYNLDGSSELLIKNGVLIKNTWGADLDNGIQASVNPAETDFYWNTVGLLNNEHSFKPQNSAKFYVYSN